MAQFKLAEVYGNGMIFQRRKPILVLGEAMEDCTLYAELDGGKTSQTVKKGRFQLELPPREAGRGLTLRVWTQEQCETLQNVYCGEVWVAGGQSNMSFELRESLEYKNGMSVEANSDIRFYAVGQNALNAPEDYGEGYAWAYSKDSGWLSCAPETAPYFSAAGYHFAQRLYAAFKVPVGVINCCVGGSGIFAWMPEEAIAANPDLHFALEDFHRQNIPPSEAYQVSFHAYLDACRAGAVDVSNIAGHAGVLPCVFFEEAGPYSCKRPCGLYHAMYEKIVDFPVRGMIWYQGESEAFGECASSYRSAMESLLMHLQSHQPADYAFHYVQLAPWENADIRQWEDICNAQREFSLAHPACGMITIGDCGGGEDIHPPRKQPVGERLALVALDHTYGAPHEYCGPIAVSASVENGGVRVSFLHAEGLVFHGTPGRFEGVYQDGSVKEASARIEGDTLFLSLENERQLACVRYEYRSNAQIGLYNAQGFPASLFMLKL